MKRIILFLLLVLFAAAFQTSKFNVLEAKLAGVHRRLERKRFRCTGNKRIYCKEKRINRRNRHSRRRFNRKVNVSKLVNAAIETNKVVIADNERLIKKTKNLKKIEIMRKEIELLKKHNEYLVRNKPRLEKFSLKQVEAELKRLLITKEKTPKQIEDQITETINKLKDQKKIREDALKTKEDDRLRQELEEINASIQFLEKNLKSGKTYDQLEKEFRKMRNRDEIIKTIEYLKQEVAPTKNKQLQEAKSEDEKKKLNEQVKEVADSIEFLQKNIDSGKTIPELEKEFQNRQGSQSVSFIPKSAVVSSSASKFLFSSLVLFGITMLWIL